jgi:hypothetical protein
LRFLIAALLALQGGHALANDLRQSTPGVHALVDVRIVTEPGGVIENGTLVIRHGIIEAVGRDIAPPDDARVHEFEREEGQDPVTVYPGLIDSYVAVEPPSNASGDEDEETPPGRHPLVRPDFVLGAEDWPQDQIEALRQAGFTSALMSQSEGLLRGSGLIANLGDGGLAANLLEPRFGQFASFDGRAEGRRFPSSLMGAVALVRQTLDDARWQQQARAAWRRNPAQARPQWLDGLDALVPALSGATPLIFKSEDLLDTLRILEFIPDGELDLVIIGHGEEYRRLDAVSARGVRHILPLGFPEPPDVKGEDDRNVSLEALRHWHAAPDNPIRLFEAGPSPLLTSHGLSQPTQIFANLARSIERGLTVDQALAGLTTEPAAFLGLSDRVGRLRPGFMANLTIVEGELFTDGPAITEVWIDGERHILSAVEAPAVDPAGTWDMTLGLGGMGDVEASLVLSGPPTSMEGTLSVMGNETPLSDVRVSGERVIVTIEASRFGGSGTISIRLNIDGERARGTGSGPFGEFTIRGRRSSGPDDEEVI